MNFTGTSLFRSIASQNEVSYNLNVTLPNVSGSTNFGFSGDDGRYNLFNFKSGNLYDINNQNIWSYNPNETILISGNIGPNYSNYYINDNIICLFSPKNNSYYKFFYINTVNTSVNFDLKINGSVFPDFRLNFPFDNLIGNNITGYIINSNSNQNFSFQFYSGQSFGQNYYNLVKYPTGFISGSRSGELVFNYNTGIDPGLFSSGLSNNVLFNGYLLINTNFGTFNYPYNIYGRSKPIYYNELITLFTGITGSFPNIFYNYTYNYQVVSSSGDTNVSIILKNFTGHTGDIYFTGFQGTGISSGISSFQFIYGSDYITGFSSGSVTSITQDYYNNYITTSQKTIKTNPQVATGDFNYFYELPLPGGSGFSEAPAGTFVTATGIGTGLVNLLFFERRSDIFALTGIGPLSGNWFEIPQTGISTGLLINSDTFYFTGIYNLNYKDYYWKGCPYLGFDFEDPFRYRLWGFTGSRNYTFVSNDSGIDRVNELIYTNQNTGILLKNLINLSSSEFGFNSGNVFDSIGSIDRSYVFSNNDGNPWTTPKNISTGYLGFEFLNFAPESSGIVTHFEIILNKNFNNYIYIPSNLKLEGSNNGSTWTQLDEEINPNFYHSSPSNIFTVSNPGLYNFIRLSIISGRTLGHVNSNNLNTLPQYTQGLSLQKIKFYNGRNITGKIEDIVKNPTGNLSIFEFNKTGQTFTSSNDPTAWWAFNKDKNLYPYVTLNGYNSFIGYESKSTNYLNNTFLTGFYIQFEDGFTPSNFLIEASTGTNYLEIYKKGNVQTLESGLLNSGLYISGNQGSGYKFFRYRFNFISSGDPVDNNNNYTCYSGWNLNTNEWPYAVSASMTTGRWSACDMDFNGGVQFLASSGGNIRSVGGYYTGVIYLTRNYGQAWTGIVATTNFAISTDRGVCFNSIAISKQNSGRFLLTTCRHDTSETIAPNILQFTGNLQTFTQGDWIPAIGTSNTLLFRDSPGWVYRSLGPAAKGFWNSSAMSYDGRVQAVVGYTTLGRSHPNCLVSHNSGESFNVINTLGAVGGINTDFKKIAMSSGGNTCYVITEFDMYKSTDSGVNWSYLYSDEYTDIATSANGQYVTAVSFYDYNGGIMVSSDGGNNFSYYNVPYSCSKFASMSSDGRYQLVVGENMPTYRSENFGANWFEVSGFSNGYYKSCSVSPTGKYQLVIGNNDSNTDDAVYFNCTFGSGIPASANEVRISNTNFYVLKNSGYFSLEASNITGSGVMVFSTTGIVTGNLYNITGQIYQPAIFYQTGLLTGTVPSNSFNGVFTWVNLQISGTGSNNKVFYNTITGSVQATGVVTINTGLLIDNDSFSIADYYFYYTTGITDNESTFNNLNDIVNILNTSAQDLDTYLGNYVGVTGYVNNNDIVLFSLKRQGEDGNAITLYKQCYNLNAIKIQNRYFRGGQTLRPQVPNGKWAGNFSKTFSTFQYLNSGLYQTIFPEEPITSELTGVIFENNFYPNWSVSFTPISEGSILNTGLTQNLNYNTTLKIFSGNYTLPSGPVYLGYSGLFIEFNKKSFDHPLNTGNMGVYIITGNGFSFTGLLQG